VALVYRAVWNDDRPQLAAEAHRALRQWVQSKAHGGIAVPDEGVAEGTSSSLERVAAGPPVRTSHPARVKVQRAVADGGGDVLRASLVENKADGSRWETTVRAWELDPADPESPDGAGWLWVDVDASADDGLADVSAVAPRLVSDLVAGGLRPRRRCVGLSASPYEWSGTDGAEGLAAVLTHSERDMPVVVFSPARAVAAAEEHAAAVQMAAVHNLGMAAVHAVDEAAARALQDILGKEFGVWGGAFRVYLPGLDPALARDDWRHRYVAYDQYVRNRSTAARLISKAVAPAAAARHAPVTYDAARGALETAHARDAGEWRLMAESLEAEAAAQRDAMSAAEDRYVDLLVDYEASLAEGAAAKDRLAAVGRDLDRALRALSAAGADEGFWEPALTQAQPVPVEAANCSDAAAQARDHLSDWLDLPEQACDGLADLDSAVESRAWGQTAWEALRALHAYAEARTTGAFEGGFWNWCESGHPLAWRATSKKLSMVESETVRQDKALWAQRNLPVDPSVDPSGRVQMEAHIKIAEGGGNLAPRIYFLHSRQTGKTHVGYFGPHRGMSNTKT
jgi:hypothetical protein